MLTEHEWQTWVVLLTASMLKKTIFSLLALFLVWMVENGC